ncbi:hypothetical protein BDV93DRAFT_372365 [Ceratobasidium sp. AG-I]|nr:hypothetical protein BDV93DRAFT_372365 [Ceratobasidium sp. AG-I]
MHCAHRPDTPGEYMMTVNRWTEPSLRPAQDHVNAYQAITPQETPLAEWGVPQWDSLTLPQALSAKLLRIVLIDHAGRLHNPDLLGERRLFNCVQWQILCAAAPSLVIYPPPFEEPPSWVRVPNPNIYLTLRWKDDKGVISPVTPHYQQDRKDRDGWDEKASWWIRGCLVTFCRRLDQPEFVKAATFRMTKALKRSGQKNAIRLLFSGQHVVGVALDSPRIRHTPTLLVYDRDMRPHDGALLIIHLLSPVLTVNKTPWAAVPPRRPAIHVLPNELIATIMELIDYETYMLMPFVSRAFRSLYLDQPRINETILMRAIPGGFAVKDRLTGETYEACLVRKRMIANYRTLNKCFQQRQLGLGLGFYTKMVENPWGSYSEETHATFKKNGREYESEYRLDHHVVAELERRSGMPEVRSQVVEGEWELERGLDLEEYGSWKDVLDPKLGWRGNFRYE